MGGILSWRCIVGMDGWIDKRMNECAGVVG
jgi:hypothetical protein